MLSFCMAVILLAKEDPPFFNPPAYESFDGQTWASVELAKTTDAGLKKMYRTSKGAMRPEGILLTQPKDSSILVDALLLGRGKDAKVSGFRVNYLNQRPPIDSLCKGFNEAPVMLYPRVRYEDWAVAAYPKRGVAFFLEHAGDGPSVEWAIVTRPESLEPALGQLGMDKSDVVEYIDPYRDLPKLMEFGYVSVSYSTSGIDVRDKNRDRDDLESDMKRIRANDYVNYHYGSAGAFTLSVSANYSAKNGGRVTVSGTLTGRTNYGKVTVSSEAHKDMEKTRSDQDPPRYIRYRSLAQDVISDIESKIRDAIAKQGPPPIESFRYADWLSVLSRAMPAK
jgi:hypothetical protein